MVNSKEILEATGIKNPKTLTRRHQQGLIPPPEIRTHPNGRGKLAYWPPWVVRRIREVRQRLAKGQSLKEICEELGCDWEAEAARFYRPRRSMKRAYENECRQKARDEFSAAVAGKVYDFLRQSGVQRPGIFARLERALANSTLISGAIALYRQGGQPAVLIRGATSKFVCDLIDQASTKGLPVTEPFIIVPIERELVAGYSSLFGE